MAVELGTLVHELDGSLQVVEKSMNIGQEDNHVAAGGQELGDFDGGDKVAAVRAACGSSS